MRTPGAGVPSAPTSSTADAAPRGRSGTDVPAYLLTGTGALGGLGWLADRALGTAFLVAVGVLAGTALSLYVIWIRYGAPTAAAGAPVPPPVPPSGRTAARRGGADLGGTP
jgi:hypothetical protein